MAKWEDKDPKWIVQERQDGSNVNGELQQPACCYQMHMSCAYILVLRLRTMCRLALGGEEPDGVE